MSETHLANSYQDWIRQKNLAQDKVSEADRIFQISKMAPGDERYRITAVFVNPSLLGMEVER
jgi:hypothetical protein